MMEKGHLLPGCLDQDHLQIGTGDFQNESGEAGAGSDIDPALPAGRTQEGEGGKRVQEMLNRDLAGLSQTGEIHLFIPADQLRVIEQKRIDLFRGKGDPQLCGAADQKGFRLLIQDPLSIACRGVGSIPSGEWDVVSVSFRRRRSSARIKIEMAAGVTPEIREA